MGLGKWLGIAAAILGVSLILFGLSHSFWWSMVLMFGAGYGMMQQIVTSNTILQTIVADDKRGRVMSFYAMSVFGFLPIGSLIAGMLASWMGAPNTLILGGALCLLRVGLVFRTPLRNPPRDPPGLHRNGDRAGPVGDHVGTAMSWV